MNKTSDEPVDTYWGSTIGLQTINMIVSGLLFLLVSYLKRKKLKNLFSRKTMGSTRASLDEMVHQNVTTTININSKLDEIAKVIKENSSQSSESPPLTNSISSDGPID